MHQVHGVNLLQGLSIRLNEEEVDGERSQQITSSKDVAVSEADTVGDERREEAEVEVPEPVAGRAVRDGLGSVATRVHLCDASPCHWSPGGGEGGDEEAGEDDHDVTGCLVRGAITVLEHEMSDACVDNEASKHP